MGAINKENVLDQDIKSIRSVMQSTMLVLAMLLSFPFMLRPRIRRTFLH